MANGPVPTSQKYKAIAERVKIIGRADDLHRKALNAGNTRRLKSLATIFAKMGLYQRSNECLIQSGSTERYTKQ